MLSECRRTIRPGRSGQDFDLSLKCRWELVRWGRASTPGLVCVEVGSGLGTRPRGRRRPSCSECQGVHPLVNRRRLKVGKLSEAVLRCADSDNGQPGQACPEVARKPARPRVVAVATNPLRAPFPLAASCSPPLSLSKFPGPRFPLCCFPSGSSFRATTVRDPRGSGARARPAAQAHGIAAAPRGGERG